MIISHSHSKKYNKWHIAQYVTFEKSKFVHNVKFAGSLVLPFLWFGFVETFSLLKIGLLTLLLAERDHSLF